MMKINVAYCFDGYGRERPSVEELNIWRDRPMMERVLRNVKAVGLKYEVVGYRFPNDNLDDVDLYIFDYGALIVHHDSSRCSEYAKWLAKFAESKPTSVVYITSQIGSTFFEGDEHMQYLNTVPNIFHECFRGSKFREYLRILNIPLKTINYEDMESL